ncbi:MAG TPA: hypothetical protein VMT93_01650 [Gemmatimonadaceae bacterium]|nr:hypothetical protein [Gemmatimonadaceae bacterium]
MRHVPVLFVLAFTTLACEKIGSGGGTSASKPDSITILNTKLAQVKAISAQQDSLLQGFQQTTQLLADIDKELSQVKGVKPKVPLDSKGEAPADPQAAYRASLMEKVQQVTALLNQSRSRVKSLTEKNSALTGQVATYEATIAGMQQQLAQKEQEMVAMHIQIDSLTTANTELTTTKAAVTDTMLALRKQENTVFYVVGTKDELMKKGIITEEGSKFLFFGSKALVPARKLDQAQFTAINKWDDVAITLHITDKPYKVVSRQDPSLIEAGKDSTGKFNGELHIVQPAEFWSTSKYLIIVEGA